MEAQCNIEEPSFPYGPDIKVIAEVFLYAVAVNSIISCRLLHGPTLESCPESKQQCARQQIKMSSVTLL